MTEPSISETAFNCPHCEAFTTQYWHDTFVKPIEREYPVPVFPEEDFRERVAEITDWDHDDKEKAIEYFDKLRSKLVFSDQDEVSSYDPILHNVFVARCYNCQKWSIWVADTMMYPAKKFGAVPSQDLPSGLFAVVDEARGIIDLSPKGAAALLRLAIQMLCVHLEQPGKNLNTDIAALVSQGLNPVVQKSLDVVRVIGNESVHPGEIDLNDDRDTALRLFDLVNVIAEQMITQPKMINELYDKLPESKKKAIEDRDSKSS